MATRVALAWRAVPRASAWDALMLALAAAHAAILLAIPSIPVIALGLWWNSNTISHNFIHRPFFRRRAANALFAAGLSMLLGFPQSLWRDRHLAHHAGITPRVRLSRELATQIALVLAVWIAIAAWSATFFVSTYLPGYLAGLGLCALHGYYEHARGTTSHYGRLYNLLLFNDGYHAEHHARPGLHWACLPHSDTANVRVSRWPAPLRWMDAFSLEGLERLVLRSGLLQRFVLGTHARALRPLLQTLRSVNRIAVVGGGLFPRTALVLKRLIPAAQITIIDCNEANLELARPLLAHPGVEYIHATYPDAGGGEYDLVIIPLAFVGDRNAVYARPPAPAVIVHDWIWRRRGTSRVVSVALLKRVNLVRA